MMEQIMISGHSKLLLLMAVGSMVGPALAWSRSSVTVDPVFNISDDSGGSGSEASDDLILPYTSLDSFFTSETTIVVRGLPTTPVSFILYTPKTESEATRAVLTYQTPTLSKTPSLLMTSVTGPFITTTTMATSQMITSTPTTSASLSSTFSLSPSIVLLSSTPAPMSTSFSSQAPAVTALLAPNDMLTTALPSEPTTLSSNILTPMSMDNSGGGPTVPLSVLIAVPAGSVVLVSVLFILIVICCMRCRKGKKYSVTKSKNKRLSDYAPRSVTPVVPDIESNVDSKKRVSNNFEEAIDDARTVGIDFPETPNYNSKENIPALIILNPVKPNIEPMSNSLWSQTLPTRQKIRKNTCSESDAPDQQDSGLMKPAKSTSALDTLTLSTEIVNKSTEDGTSMTFLLPEAMRKRDSTLRNKRNDYDHLPSEEELLQATSEMNGEPHSLGSTGYVFLEPAGALPEKKSSVHGGNEAKKDLQPSSIPVLSQLSQHILQRESSITTAETESIYDTPKSAGIDMTAPKLSKQSTSSGSTSSTRDTASSIECLSHYDVPKSALLAYKEEGAKNLSRFSVPPNSTDGQESAAFLEHQVNSPQECHYDSLGAGSLRPYSPPYYDIPKLLLQAKNSGGQKFGSSEGLVQETNMDELESSDEHVYCVPPDVVMNILKTHKSSSNMKMEDSKTVTTSARKPIPKGRKKNEKNDNTPQNGVIPAPTQIKNNAGSLEDLLNKTEPKSEATSDVVPTSQSTRKSEKSECGSINSSQEELLDKSEAKSDANNRVEPAPKPVTKSTSNAKDVAVSSQDLVVDKPERKVNVPTMVEPAPRPVKKSTSNSSAINSISSSQEKLLESKSDVSAHVPAPRQVVKSPSNSSGLSSFTILQEKPLDKPESKSDVTLNVTAPRPVKKSLSNSSSLHSVSNIQEKLKGDASPNVPSPRPVKKSASNSSGLSSMSSQETLLDGSESKGHDINANRVPLPRPARLSILKDLSGSDITRQVLSELKSKRDPAASAVPTPKPIMKKKPIKHSLADSSPGTVESDTSEQGQKGNINSSRSPSPAITSRPLGKKPAIINSPGSITTSKLLSEQVSTSSTRNTQLPPTIFTKPVKKTIKSSITTSFSVTSSMEKLLEEPELESSSSSANTSPAHSKKQVKKHTRGKSTSDVVATPGPMVAKEPEPRDDTAKMAPATKPVVAKKPNLLARTASLEELLSDSKNKELRPSSPKPSVRKKPAVQASMSSSGSQEDLLSQSELKNGRASPLRPVVAKRRTKIAAKKSSSTVSSSAEDLLSTPEAEKVKDIQSVSVNGDSRDDSPPLGLDVRSGEAVKPAGQKKSRPKPKIIPRSHSRQAIVQELGETASTDLAPVRPPTIPTRPSQRPPPITQRPVSELKAPVNAA